MNETTRKLLFTSQIRRNFLQKQRQLFTAKTYLKNTDYIVIKIYEAVIKGQDTSELLSKYAEQLTKRETYRNSIDTLEVEVKTLEKEWREERARIIAEEVIKQPSEVVEETPRIEQPIEDTTEVVENLE